MTSPRSVSVSPRSLLAGRIRGRLGRHCLSFTCHSLPAAATAAKPKAHGGLALSIPTLQRPAEQPVPRDSPRRQNCLPDFKASAEAFLRPPLEGPTIEKASACALGGRARNAEITRAEKNLS